MFDQYLSRSLSNSSMGFDSDKISHEQYKSVMLMLMHEMSLRHSKVKR